MPPPTKKRKKSSSAIEEITFNPDARADYLTGFHKRKVQRIKHAQEDAAKKDKVERIEDRKRMREERKADLEKHVETVNAMLREANDESTDTEGEGDERDMVDQNWNGFEDVAKINHEDEYIDEDKFTTVTVEAIDISKNGLQKASEDPTSGEEEDEHEVEGGKISRDEKVSAEQKRNGKRIWTKEKPEKPRKKKKKFRYETKAERKVTRFKERSGNNAKAKARKG
ncbi:MAG: hypothetical protein M1827_000829 [Pycnora praestabilis]|nr:MAG: hypothetical protein M1827_000829 [Pycnora praestabilis]